MAVVRRGKVWQVQVRVGKDPRTGKWIRKAATADSRSEAERVERKLLAESEAQKRRFCEPSAVTLGAYLGEWLERKQAEGRRASTLDDYARQVKDKIVPVLGAVKLQDLSPAAVQRWQDGLAASPSVRGATRAANAHRVLRSALSDAVRLGMISTNPAKVARPALRTPRKRKGHTLEQARALFAAAEPRWDPLFRFLYYGGLRPGEALGLQWSAVNQQTGTIMVVRSRVLTANRMVEGTPKTAAGMRAFVLPGPAMDALRTQWALQAEARLAAGVSWEEGDWVFTTHDGGPLDLRHVNRAYQRARMKAGLPKDLPLYSLRHGNASVLLGSGVPLGVAAKMMGHSQVAVFADTYASLLLEASAEAARKVEAFMADQEEQAKQATGGTGKEKVRRLGRPWSK